MKGTLLGVALSLGFAAAAAAQEKTTLERLEEMEKEVRELKEKLEKKEAGEKGETKPAPKSKPKTVSTITAFDRVLSRTRVGGYFDLEFFDFRHANSRFDNHRIVVAISSWLHERLFFSTEIEYEHGDELHIEQGWLDFMIDDAINFRAGVILVPMSKLNLLHDSDFRDLTLRPITTTILVPSTWSEAGAGFHGNFYLGGLTLHYETYIFNGLTDDLRTSTGTRPARASLDSDNNSDKTYCARLEAVAWGGKFIVGAGAYRGRYDDDGRDTIFMQSADVTLAIPLAPPGGWISGPLEFRVEGAHFSADKGLNPAGAEIPRRGIGGFAQVSFHFFPPFLKDTFLGKDFENPTFTLVALWDAVELDAPHAGHDNHQRRLSFGLNYRPIEQVAFKVEYVDEDSDEIFGNFEQDGWAVSLAAGF